MYLYQLSLSELSRKIKDRKASPTEVTLKILERINVINSKINAFITVAEDAALQKAKELEKEIIAGKWRGPLHGIPIGVKDLIYTKDLKTTMGSEIFKDYQPDYNATAVTKLEQAGAIIIGKLNTHQFAYGPTGDRSYFGGSRNPYNFNKITGGSSGGSGAAVAAKLCYGALGTDTGGSIRIPSSCCGIVGMKPTYGRISNYGSFPLAWTLDSIGPMTRTVEDNALLLSTLVDKEEDFTHGLKKDLIGRTIGIPQNFYFDNLQDEVESIIKNAINAFKSLGAKIKIINIPGIEKFLYAQQIIIKTEAYTVHHKLLEEKPELYEEEVRERLLTGLKVKGYEYVLAKRMRNVAIDEFNRVLEQVDTLLAPTLPIVPTDYDQRMVAINGEDVRVRLALTNLTGPTNLNGFPSLNIPCGFSKEGLPVGLQLIGRPFDEANLYNFAYLLEQELDLNFNPHLVC